MDHHAPRPVVTALRLLKPVVLVLLLVLLVLAALSGGAAWLLRSEGGTRWLLAQVPGVVQAEGLRGALFGDRIEVDRLRVFWAGGRASVTITGLVGDVAGWQWQPDGRTWLGVEFTRLAARSVVVDTGPPSGKPVMMPASLALPLRISAARVEVDEVQVNRLAPFRRVSGSAAISDGGAHHAEGVRFEWEQIRLQGDVRIASTVPYAMAGNVQAAPADEAYAATLRAGGKLERIELDATLRSRPQPGRATPSADLHSIVLPYAAWPFAELSARTEALDLSALVGSAPETRIAGSAQVRRSSADTPIGATLQFDNTLPGRWNEHRLPLRHLALDLQSAPDQRDRLELKAFDILFASGTRSAGRWHGKGRWNKDLLEGETTLEEVQPQQLDGRAAAMSLSGPLAFGLHGLPSPDPAAGITRPAWALTARAKLDGRLDAAPQPVKLEFEAVVDEHHAELRDLRASSGAAVAQGHASASRGGGGEWQLESAGTLSDFDPLPWWPGELGSAWRQGPHRLNASWQLDVRVPPGAGGLAPLALAQRLAGSGSLDLHDSVLGGVPLALDLTLGHSPSIVGTPSTLRGELHLGGNKIAIDGVGDPAGAGSADRINLDLDAPSLASLAPLLRLGGATLAAWAPKSGALKAGMSAFGRWPQLRTEGQAELVKLETGELGVTKGSLNWHLDFQGDGERPLQMQAELGGLRWGRQRAEQLRAELRGTLRSHQLQITGALPLAPPPVAEQLFGMRSMSGTRAQLEAEGSWQREASGSSWRGRIARLAVGAWDGAALTGEVSAGWVDARNLSAHTTFDALGNLQHLVVAPGELRFADAVALRWNEVDADLHGDAWKLALRAEVEPFTVAPLLARAQPSMGWRGDLRLAATIDVRAAERFDADVVLERRDGDLQVSDENGVQTALGLTDLRMSLAAHDGGWSFALGLAGRTLGELAGSLRATTTPERRWPPADAPMDGVVEARVANLGVWGTWVPPGWRLTGELRTSATIGGRFGAPEYTGAVSGHDIGVRNLLQGVNISQGDVSVKLEGASAKIERFTLKGGDGTLKVTGGAEFGSTPSAQLRLTAERFRLLGRVDRLLTASGSADLALKPDQVKLDGKFTVDEGLFDAGRSDAPSLDDDVSVHRPGDVAKPAEAAAAQRPRRDVAVTVDVDLGQDLRVRGRGLDAELRGQLRITTPGGRLNVAGTVSTENGTYAAYAQKLDIDHGIVAFSGPPDNPRLDILALRRNIDSRVGVQITGNLLTPRVKLYSDTDMSDTDRLSWLMLGRAPDGLGRSDTLLLQRAAVALLAGEGEAPTDALIKAIGLDEISFKQSDTDVRETVISFGKQLSRRWYLGYERGVNATTGTFQLIYRIAQRFTLRAQSGSENSLDIIWSWKFDEVPLPGGMRKSTTTPP